MSGPLPAPMPVPKPCPACGAGPGTLTLGPVLVSRPLASFSLAGAGMKTSALLRMVLTCSDCGMRVLGYLSPDLKHFHSDDGQPPASRPRGGAPDGA